MLGGMVISSRGAQGKPAVTTLKGTLIDQACLMGVLTALYEMGYTLAGCQAPSGPGNSLCGDRRGHRAASGRLSKG